jgi:hypothetical protein
VRRKTISKRMRAKLLEIKQQLRRRMHESVELNGKWLRSIVQGYFNYHAVPGNIDSLSALRCGDPALADHVDPSGSEASPDMGADAKTG